MSETKNVRLRLYGAEHWKCNHTTTLDFKGIRCILSPSVHPSNHLSWVNTVLAFHSYLTRQLKSSSGDGRTHASFDLLSPHKSTSPATNAHCCRLFLRIAICPSVSSLPSLCVLSRHDIIFSGLPATSAADSRTINCAGNHTRMLSANKHRQSDRLMLLHHWPFGEFR